MANKKIILPHVIACEGIDAENFIRYFLEFLYKKQPELDNNFFVYNFGGNEELLTFLKSFDNFLLDGLKVKSLLVIRDAETDGNAAEKSVKDALKKNSFPVPDTACRLKNWAQNERNINTAYALFPSLDSNINGTLEDLCLQILKRDTAEELLKISDNALCEAADKFGKFTRPHKNRLYTYLSLEDSFVSLKLGEAAKANAFNFESERLCTLKNILNEIIEA
ncbi:MAG: hypothetical protein LBS74_06690 [Oscillospiraceae bacterium]|nr:hypothetical protein [Oscillospiraceae bacterium]